MVGVIQNVPVKGGPANGMTFPGPPTRIRHGGTTYRLALERSSLVFVPETELRRAQALKRQRGKATAQDLSQGSRRPTGSQATRYRR